MKLNRIVFALGLAFVWAPMVSAQGFHKGVAAQPAAGSMFVVPSRIFLSGSDSFTAYRGQLFAQLNRNQPDSEVVSVEFFMFPRNEDAPQDTPPVFLLNGGPGFPGLSSDDLKKLVSRFRDEFLGFTDVVVVGQRGIGTSLPNTTIRVTRPPAFSAGNERGVTAFQDSMKSEREFWLNQGVDLSGFTADQAATDVMEIATGLGYQKITLFGGSFGSHWGMTVMRKHPEIVARAVLHGVEGPDHTWDHPGWIWNVYRRVAEDAESADNLAAHIPDGGIIAAVENLVQRASESPIEVLVDEKRDHKVLIDAAKMKMLARGYSRDLKNWPAEVLEMHSGQFKTAGQRLGMMTLSIGTMNSTASFWALDSSSGISAKRRQEFEADPALDLSHIHISEPTRPY